MLIDETLYTPLNTCPLCGNRESELIRVENNKFPANNEKDKLLLEKMVEDFHSSKQILKVSRLRYYYKLLKNHLFSKKE